MRHGGVRAEKDGKTEPEPFDHNAEAFKVDKNNLYGIGSPVRTDVQLGVLWKNRRAVPQRWARPAIAPGCTLPN
ncbi:MAG: hypothetical protein ACLRTQ_06250 [Candidatus Borkfalkia sp.]